jgi:hypothetical protein
VKSTRDMETETDQGSEIQEEVGQTWIPMDHRDARIEQYPYQDLGFREEGWPATGQVKEEEEDYVYQPQTGPGPEPMDKEVEEEMAGEDIGLGPTWEEREGAFVIRQKHKWFLKVEAYLRHMDEFIVHNLCIIFNL